DGVCTSSEFPVNAWTCPITPEIGLAVWLGPFLGSAVLAEPVTPMASALARSVKPRRCIGLRSADWGSGDAVAVRCVFENFICSSLIIIFPRTCCFSLVASYDRLLVHLGSSRPGARRVTSWTIHALPSGSSKMAHER